ADHRLAAGRGHRRHRALDHRQRLLLAERIIIGLGLEFYPARLALAALDAPGGIGERRLVGFCNLLEERPVVAAAFAAHVDVISDDIGGIARRPAFAAGDRA